MSPDLDRRQAWGQRGPPGREARLPGDRRCAGLPGEPGDAASLLVRCASPPLPSTGGAGGACGPRRAPSCVSLGDGAGGRPPRGAGWLHVPGLLPSEPPGVRPAGAGPRSAPSCCEELGSPTSGGPAPRLCVTAPRPAAFPKQLFAAWWVPPPTARLRASQRPPRSPLGHCRDCAGAEPMPARGRPGLGCDGAPHVLPGCGSCTRLVSKWAACTPGVGSCPAVSLSWEPCAGRGGG